MDVLSTEFLSSSLLFMLWYVRTWYLSIVLLQEENQKLKRAIENNDTALIQHMFQGNNINVNANINAPEVCMYC